MSARCKYHWAVDLTEEILSRFAKEVKEDVMAQTALDVYNLQKNGKK